MTNKSPVELLISIVNEVIELSKGDKLSTKELKEILFEADIPPQEARDIVLWFQNFVPEKKHSKQKGKKHGSKNSIRLFTTEEKNKIPNHCLNKLNELCLYKIITPKDRELIIVQAMAIKQNKLTDEHFHWICQMVITNQPTKDLSQSNEQDNKKDILRFVLQKDKMEITAH
jgi:uncharacterized protein Smg (DUF494 family)